MRSGPRIHPLQAAALAAVLLHGALAMALLDRSAGLAGKAGAAPSQPAGLQVRLQAVPTLGALTATLTPVGQDPATTAPASVAKLDATPDAPSEPSADEAPDGEHGEAATLTYFGREDLDLGPRSLARIQIAYPEGVPDQALQAGRLTLFIDEHGTVKRILVLDQSLPPPFQEAARNAFLQARFAPAERAGRIVRARIDVEVVFDARQARVVSTHKAIADSPT